MKKRVWIRRSAKFFGFLTVVIVAAIYLSDLSGGWAWEQRLRMLLFTTQGRAMLLAVLAAAALYPLYGFGSRTAQADFSGDGERIVQRMRRAGFCRTEHTAERMVFRAVDRGLQLRSLFEDEVVIEPAEGSRIRVSGNRWLLWRINRYLWLNNTL